MSLAERAKQQPERINGQDCSVCILLRILEGEELTAFLTMLGTDEERGWSQNEIYEALTAEGYEVARHSINKHRARNCRGFR